MTGTAVASRAPTRVEAFMQEVLPPHQRQDIYSALPAHISPARFERNLVNAIMREPKLLGVNPRIVYREVSKIAAVGLLLDPAFGEAYLIVDRNNDVQARFGYRGLIKLARQSGQVNNIFAHEICENDEYRITLGTNKQIEHTPLVMGDRGKPGAFYAVVEFKDGPPDFEIMSIAEIEAIRDRSDAWRAFKAGKIKTTPWATDGHEMAKKTVLRRLLKRIPMSPELSDALAHEDTWDERDSREQVVIASTIQNRLRGPVGQGFSTGHVDEELGAAGADEGDDATVDASLDTVGGADQGAPEGQGAPQGQQDLQSGQEDDPDAEGGEPPTEAYLRGREMRRQGVSAKAVPGEYRDDEQAIADWRAGWSDENDAQKGAAQ